MRLCSAVGWRKARLVLFCLMLLGYSLFVTGGSGLAAEPPANAVSLMVKLVDGLSPDDQQRTITRNGGTEIASIPALRLHVIAVPVNDSPLVMENYHADPQVERVEVDRARKAEGFPNDPLYPMQWWLPRIGWEEAFGTVQPAGTVTVAILDTGIDGGHPDLAGRVVPGTSFLDGSTGLTDNSGHGTALAGIVAAVTDNDTGIAAVGYQGISVMPVSVINADGVGWDSDIIAGILWAVEHGADIILMGFSNPAFSDNLQEAIDHAWAQGAVLVAATGNEAVNSPAFPAGNRGVIGVAATDREDRLAPTSNYGAAVFLAAPGTEIFTTALGGGYADFTGTSASAAIVAGAAALLRAADPELTNGSIVGRLARTTDPAGTIEQTGNGRINLGRALADTSTGAIQPAGAPPVGSGGPYLGPYTLAAATSITLMPAAGANGTSVQIAGAGFRHPMEIRFTFAGTSVTSVPSPCITSGNIFSCSIVAPGLPPGTYPVVATEATAAGPRSASANFDLLKAGTTVTVTASAANPLYGDTLTLNAAVGPVPPAGGAPSGTVRFRDGDIVLGTVAVDAGTAALAVAGLPAGTHAITAEYSGDSSFAVAAGNLQLTVLPAPLAVAADPQEKTYGSADPPLIYTWSGLQNGDSAAVFSGALERVAGENVGSYTIGIGSLNAGGNYQIVFTGAPLTIEPALLTVTVGDASRPYAAADPGFTASYAGFVNGEILATSGVSGTPSLTTTADASSPVGTYPIVAARGSLAAANYTFTFVNGTLTVGKAVPVITWATPAAIVYGTSLAPMQLAAAAGVPGSFAYAPPAGTVLDAGIHTLTAAFAPADPANYEAAVASVAIAVLPAPLHVIADAQTKGFGTADPPLTYSWSGLVNGDTPAVLGGALEREPGESVGRYAIGQGTLSAGSNYEILYTGADLTIAPASGSVMLGNLAHLYDGTAKSAAATTLPAGLAVVITYAGAPETPVDAGSYAVVATITDPNYAGSATGVLTIARALPTVSWENPPPLVYGKPLGAAELAAAADVPGTFVYAPESGAVLAAGTHTLTATFTPADAGNYQAALSTVRLDVVPAPLAVTAETQTKVYGTADPPLTYHWSGLVNGDTPAVFSGALTREPGKNVGSYPIRPGSLGAGSNYTVAFTGADLTITPARLTVTADAASRPYAAANPIFTATYSGFVRGETLATSGVTGAPSLATGATPATPIGAYPIVAGQGSLAAANYAFIFVDGTLSVTRATPLLTWNAPAPIAYGTPLGAAQLNASAGIPGTFAYSPAAGTVLTIGQDQPLTVTFTPADTSNYTSATAAVTIDVVEKEVPLVTWATPADIVYGNRLGATQFNATANVPGTFTYTPAAGTALAAGSHTLTLTFTPDDLVRYEATTAAVTLNVLRAPLTVTAQDKNKTYGAPEPPLTYIWSGLTNGDTAATFTGGLERDPGETVGSYAIGQGTLAAGANYAIAFTGAELTITPAPLTVRATSAVRPYGQPNPAFAATFSGFVNGETLATSGVAGSPELTTAAESASPVGTYPIVVAAGSLSAANYAFTLINGTLTVTKATPAITWGTPADIVYGTPLGATQLNATATVPGNFVYSPAAGTVMGAGSSQMLSATFTPTDSANFNPAAASVRINVAKAPLAVTADAKTKLFGGPDPPLTYTWAGLVGGDAESVFTGTLVRAAGENVGRYPIGRGSLSAGSNYQIAFTGAELSITAESATVILSELAHVYDGTPKSAQAATLPAGLAVDITYNGARSVPVNAGSYLVVASIADPNYAGSATGTLTIARAAQTIAFPPLADKVYGDAPFAAGASASSGLPANLSASGACTLSGTNVVLTAAGNCTITAAQAGNSNFEPAPAVARSFTVAKAALTVNVASKNKVYGQAFTAFTGTLSGIVPADNITVVYASDGAPASAAAGSYPITATFIDPAARLINYQVTVNPGTLTVAAAPLTVTAQNKSKLYGAALPPLDAAYSGFAAGDGPAGLAGTLTCSTPATEASAAGSYAIACSGQTSGNYVITYVNGTLTVAPAPLTITANGKSRMYGETNPSLDAAYSGFVRDENAAVLSGILNCGTPASPASPVATYPITCGGQTAANYSLSYIAGQLTVTRAPLTVVSDPQTKVYGQPFTAFSGTLGGLRVEDVITPVWNSSGAPATAAVGKHPISASFNDPAARLGNYTVLREEGLLTVTPAPLTVNIDNQTKAYGQTLAAFTGAVAGVQAGDNLTPVYASTGAATAAAVGSYPITVGWQDAGNRLGNYTVTANAGVLTVTPVPLTITATDKTRLYGSGNPAFGATYAGFVAGDAASRLTGSLDCTSPATIASEVGDYPIVCGGQSSINYDIQYMAGVLAVTPAPLTVTVDNKVKGVGEAFTAFTGNVAGLKAGDAVSATYASAGSPAAATVGTYPITATLSDPAGRLGNYALTLGEGTLTVLPVYTITATGGGGGVISPAGSVLLKEGYTQAFTVTPASGYQVRSVTGCGGTMTGNLYTTAPVGADCAVEATFTLSEIAAPTRITVPASSTTGNYQVSWYASVTPGVDGYVLEESADGGSYREIYRGTQRYQNISGRQDGTYHYRVKALKSGYMDSAWQNSVVCAVVLTCSAPTVINAPTTSITGNYQVSWFTVTSPTGVTYVLEESANGNGFTEIYRGTLSYHNVVGHPDGAYTYRVKAIKNGYADSTWKTSAACAVLLTCAAPNVVNVPATSITGAYQVSWAVAASPVGVTYVLEESINGGTFAEIYRGTQTYHYVAGRPDGSYQYRVRATKNGYADSEWRLSASCAVVLTCATPNVINVPATAKYGSYQVSWSPAASPAGVTYVLEESFNDGAWAVVQSGSQTYRNVAGKAAGSYSYRVKASKNGYLDSAWKTSSPCLVGP